MRKSSVFLRICSAAAVLCLIAALFSVRASTEQYFSDWYTPEPAEEPGVTMLEAAGKDYAVRVTSGEGTEFPGGAELVIREADDPAEYLEQAAEAIGVSPKKIEFFRVFDISIRNGKEPFRPESPVHVEISMAAEGDAIRVLHFPAAAKKRSKPKIDVIEPAVTETAVSFDTDSFSVFAVAGYTLEKDVLASDGNLYHITVTYGDDAEIPEGAELAVQEILEEEGAVDGATPYENYAAQAQEALGWQERIFSYARFFDISIIDGNGKPVQPAEGAEVQVSVTLADKEDGVRPMVVHFGGETQAIVPETEGDTVRFSTGSFSVYGIVDAPEPVPQSGWNRAATVSELLAHAEDGFLIHSPGGYYFMDTVYNVNASRTGIRKTAAFSSPDSAAGTAALYFLVPQGDSSDRFKAYCEKDGETLYVRQSGNSLSLTTNADEATVFTIDAFPGSENTFRVLGTGGYYWNMQGGNGGKGFAAYNSATDTNARIQFEYYAQQEDDPYGLDGKTYGIAYYDDSVTAAALTAAGKTVSGQQRLAGKDLVMRPDVLDNEGVLLVANNSDITEWTFTNVREDLYYITTEADGQTRYLTIDGSNVYLAEEPDETGSLITARPGTGENAGKWHFTAGGRSLNLQGTADNGFNGATGSGKTTWMNLVQKSVLTEDDFHVYNAKKVSVSDTDNVYNHQQVVIYTRVWNDTAKRYDFYAVNHDGSLILCHDNGDLIEWIGSRVNTALWEFTEYYETDGSANYYYELRNTQYGEYIAPQAALGQVTSGNEIGINLNGRRYGENYTTIIAWDDGSYSYSGLKTENGHVVACPLAEAEDFYFAVVNPVDPDDQISEVATLDNGHYGITMKMVDFNNPKTGSATSPRDSVQNPFFGGDNNNPGLLSTNLSGNYPTTTSVTGNAGHSLSELFRGMTTVNHLFLNSIHNESGYFEYDSTSNFARLNSDGNFTVYDQLGAIGDYATNTGKHGQFMPYNDLVPGRYCDFTNTTSVTAQELPDTNPRKGEKLYNIGYRSEVDYHFGMEMEAQFTQTASGLDAWGHDIIFEFSGDDDFWFYVDDELVLDLGGVHSAMTGSINFRTGEVKSSRGNSTLYEIFRSNYRSRGMSEDEISRKLDEIFQRNANGQYVFKDYTNHTMRMFYMERGAGASNLHMRFNLAAVKPGSFILTKKLSGTENPANDLIEFPYQIVYYTRADGGTTPHLLGENPGEAEKVYYKDSNRNVKYAETFTPAGGTVPYEHVFFLRPGQAAEVNMPEDVLTYYVTECGVNPFVYEHVYENNTELAGIPSGNPSRNDYSTAEDTLQHRPQVDFDNHVREGAMRTLQITKKLYDVDGQTLLHYPENTTVFSYRLYLGSENEDADDLPPANLYRYYVKDGDGNYCRWDKTQQRFVSLGITEFSQLTAYLNTLTDTERETIVFVTSMNGSISRIPADHTVEVRDLIVGSQYKVEERSNEIPKGYTLRVADGYTRVDVSPEQPWGDRPYSGTTQVDESPEIEVRNQKGWGLTIEKIWTDRDFMESHDPLYFAVYIENETGGYSLLDGYVRELKSPETSLYYFFDNLQSGIPFNRYVVFEVVPEGNFTVDSEGCVTGYTGITRIEEGGTLETGGTPAGGEYGPYRYTAHYEYGESTGHNENIRTDTVTNSRPGIELYKQDPEGEALPGAVFTLTDENGRNVSAASYTSDANGLITIAYLPGGTWFLTEIATPKGYIVMEIPIQIDVDGSGIIISGGDEDLYTVTTDQETSMIIVTIRNRPVRLRVMKTDGDTGLGLPDAHFALYHQVTDTEGHAMKDYLPIAGYEDLVSDEDGILAELTEELPYGTYYLTETQAPEGYVPISEDLCFTVGTDGKVTIHTAGAEDWLRAEEDPESGEVSYTLSVPNRAPGPVETTVVCSKQLNGRDMNAGEFSFRMTPVDENGEPTGESMTALNQAAAAGEASLFSFSLTYEYADYEQAEYRDSDGNAVFLYLVQEDVSPNADERGFDPVTNIAYDKNIYLAIITLICDEETGLLSTKHEYRLYDPSQLPLNELLGLETAEQEP